MPERILGGGGPVVSPFGLSQTLSVGGGLLVPCSLPRPPVVKQLMQMVTNRCLARVGGFNQCASPNNVCESVLQTRKCSGAALFFHKVSAF